MPSPEEKKANNAEAVTSAIKKLDSINYDTVSQHLPRMLVEGTLILDHTAYTPTNPGIKDPCGIGRYLIYDNPDKSNPFSIWAFAIASGQKTSIHDHAYRGTVTALSMVSEKLYELTPDSKAQRRARMDRHRFHTSQDNLEGNFVHQLKCRKGLQQDTSVTLHIYNMEAHTLNAQQERVDRRNFARIYEKAPSDARGREPYVEASSPTLS